MSNESSALPRNFTVTTDERVRAMMSGPPAYMRRRRRIEDLEANIVFAFRAHAEKGPIDHDHLPVALVRALASLRELVALHNRYYPIEANLPIDIATGGLLDFGKPWAPMPMPTFESLLAAGRR
jgi:hypothetical protein